MTEPTHIRGHTLDLVITRKIEDILASPPRACRYFSDHAAVHCHVAISKPSFQTRIIKFRKTKSLDAESLSNDVVLTGLCDRGNSDPITPLDLDVLVEDYTTTLSQVLDRHAPLKTKTVRARPKVPWYTSEIAEAKRRRRKAERRWRRTRSQEDLLAFKKLKNHVTYLSTRAKRAFYSDFVNDNSENQGKLFRATRSLLLPRNELCFPEYTDNSILANDIGRFFDRKIAKIRAELDACTLHPGAVAEDRVFTGDRKLDHFNTYSVEDIRKLVSRSSKKSCQLDPIPTRSMLLNPNSLMFTHTLMIHSSISHLSWMVLLLRRMLLMLYKLASGT